MAGPGAQALNASVNSRRLRRAGVFARIRIFPDAGFRISSGMLRQRALPTLAGVKSPLSFLPPTDVNSTRICLVRHGETAWNVQRRIQGQLDIPLNATGISQADVLAERLADQRFAAIYSSDLGRARLTAAAAARRLMLDVALQPDLRERHYGMFQALTYEEAERHHPAAYRRFHKRDPDFAFGDGESLKAFAARVMQCLTSLAQLHAGEQILLVAHGGVLDIVRRAATAMSLEAPRDFAIPNAALNWLDYVAGGWRLVAWGDRSVHVEALDELPG